MKILTALLLAACLTAAAAGHSQTITLHLHQASLQKVFREIRKQTGYLFLYHTESIGQASPVDLDVTGAGLREVLDRCFRDQPLTWELMDRTIIVRPRENQPATAGVTGRDIDLKGRVENEAGEPLEGITVGIRGSTRGTSTNREGEFHLEGVNEQATLVLTGTNIETLEVKVAGRSQLRITVRTRISRLDEVQVIGYGSVKRRYSTGSVSTLSADKIGRQPVTNPLAVLQGQVPGVYIQTQNGMPGGNFKVEIRGRGSIAAGTSPLFIVDGVPYESTPLNNLLSDFTPISGYISPLNGINPADIESISVLKDADATAIYGSRGANGVVLITTKKGKAGASRIELGLRQGFSQLSSSPDLLGLRDYLTLRREAFAHDGVQPNAANAPDLVLWDTTHGTNWVKYLLGNRSPLTQASGSISGGNAQLNFLFSTHFRHEGILLPGQFYYEQAGGLLNLNHESANHRFRLAVSTQYNTDKDKSIIPSTLSVFTLPPNYPLYDDQGKLNWTGTYDNPLGLLRQRARSNSGSWVANTTLNYLFPRKVSLQLSAGYTRVDLDQVMIQPLSAQNPLLAFEGSSSFGHMISQSLIAEPQLQLERRLGQGTLSILAGASYQQSRRSQYLLHGTNYSNEDLMGSIAGAGTIAYASTSSQEYRYGAVFARINYNLQKKYLINASLRRDGSSRFGPGREFGNFGAVGAAWLFGEEKGVRKSLPWLSFGKLKASYGLTGNDQIADYQYLSTYGAGSPYDGGSTLQPERLANSRYSWETTRKLEAGMELGFFRDRLLGTFTWFYNRSGNQLVSYPVPYLTGFSSYQANLPALVQNEGWELDLQATLLRAGTFQWTTSLNLTIPRNRLVRYPGLASSPYANLLVEGQDLSVVKGLHFLGIDPQTGVAEFQDRNGDGRIDRIHDLAVIGRTSPYYYGGFTNELRWKGFSCNLFLQFSKQFSKGASILPGYRLNQFSVVMDRWQQPGDQTDIPRAMANPSPDFTRSTYLQLADRFFYNTAYLRLKNLTLGYQLPEAALARLKMKGCYLGLNAQNLLTVKKRASLYDPETQLGGIAPFRTLLAEIRVTL